MAYEDVKAQLHGREREEVANNTYLELGEDWDGCGQVAMRLHGYPIAVFEKDYISLSACGWHTHTTKDRIGMALRLAKVPFTRIYQYKWDWYIGYCSPKVDTPFFNGIKLNYQGDIVQ